MIKSLLLLITLFVCINSYTQTNSPTLRETQLWLKDIIENNGLEIKGGNLEYSYKYYVNYSDDGDIIIYENFSYNNTPPTFLSTYTIPIKIMKKVTYEILDDRVEINLETKFVSESNMNPITEVESNDSDGKLKVTAERKLSGIFLKFRKSFLENDLPNRFVEGMNHLIYLNGGEIVKEVF